MPRDPDDVEMDEASFDRVRGILAGVDASDAELVEPPTDLWSRIAREVEAPADQDRSDTGRSAPEVVSDAAPVVVLADRRRRWILAAAAVIVIVAGILGGIVLSRNSPSTTVVATASLQPLEGRATADAKLVRSDGKLKLQLIAHDMPAAPDGQYYELWLMDESLEIPVSLGSMTGSTTVTLPAGVDTDRFPVVDISLQPNGQPDYSGHSVLRGTLS